MGDSTRPGRFRPARIATEGLPARWNRYRSVTGEPQPRFAPRPRGYCRGRYDRRVSSGRRTGPEYSPQDGGGHDRRAADRAADGPGRFVAVGFRCARRGRRAAAQPPGRAAAGGPARAQPDDLPRRRLRRSRARRPGLVAHRAAMAGSATALPPRTRARRRDLARAAAVRPAPVLPRRLQLPRPGRDLRPGPRPLPARARHGTGHRRPAGPQHPRPLAQHPGPLRPAVPHDWSVDYRCDRQGRPARCPRLPDRRARRARDDRVGAPPSGATGGRRPRPGVVVGCGQPARALPRRRRSAQ